MHEVLDISVIIPVYNASTLIKRCLDSILIQKGGYSYEVLLVDDGSTDDSVAIIESYKNPSFKIFQQENAGPAKARNKGLQEAKGKYVCYLVADDYWGDCYIEKTRMIPKLIDYSWFSGEPSPPFLKECMSSKGDYPQFEGKMFGGLENYLYICSVIFE